MSTNVVIVQDTDVTITGVYVNSTLGSSQEAYCKMQYRVQSSVTEERMLIPGQEQPPKSYTPLSALSCMLPPGSGDNSLGKSQVLIRLYKRLIMIYQSGVVDHIPVDNQPPATTIDPNSPPIATTSSFMPHPMQHQPQPPHQSMHQPHYSGYPPPPPHMHHPSQQQQHMQSQSQPPNHHQPQSLLTMPPHHRQSPPPPHCESPFGYEPMYSQQPLPPPPSIGQSSSAFCAIGQQQNDANSKYNFIVITKQNKKKTENVEVFSPENLTTVVIIYLYINRYFV